MFGLLCSGRRVLAKNEKARLSTRKQTMAAVNKKSSKSQSSAKGMTAMERLLLDSVRDGKLELVRKVLDKGASVDTANEVRAELLTCLSCFFCFEISYSMSSFDFRVLWQWLHDFHPHVLKDSHFSSKDSQLSSGRVFRDVTRSRVSC